MADRPISIVHVMPQIGIGGAELQLHALIRHSDPGALSHEVLYYSDSRDDEGLKLYREAGIRLHRVPRNKRRPLRFIGELAHAIGERRPDIVHAWLFSGVIWGRLAAIRAGCRPIVLCHRSSYVPYAWAMRVLESLTHRGMHYLVNSKACASAVAGQIGISPQRFSVIYNGIDPAAFEVDFDDSAEVRKELGIPDDGVFVLTVGRLTPAKNYPMFLRIARRCREAGLNIHFVVAGHGELEADLREAAAQMGLADTVRFLGLRRDTIRLLKAADFFCYTSWFEGFPNALLEAMLAGLPIVTTDFAGANELIQDGQNGRVVKRDSDVEAFAALHHLVYHPELARQMGQHARQIATDQFSIQRMVEQTTKFYRRLLAAGETSSAVAIGA